METKQFAGRVFIVTGGTQGLGKAIASSLADQGAKGIVICGRNENNGTAAAKALQEKGTEAVYVKADLQVVGDCRKVVKVCDETFGRVDGLVNAGALTTRGSIENATVELWDQLFDVNARAPFILSQEVIKIMKRDKIKGSIVNIISKSSHGGQPYLTVYSASKGALAVLTKNIAYAMRYDRIRVNGINLGWMASEGEHAIQKSDGKPENWLELAEKAQPFGRLIYPEDAAKLAVYLLSDDSEMMTGSLIDFEQDVVGCMD